MILIVIALAMIGIAGFGLVQIIKALDEWSESDEK